ncbi:hypothetical protein MNBD_IGNAVI01-3126 [hydrothermal vent metagenome]|uniref:Secretion system C-terminal sorting domain-containing protein n=1 Tax=hydrothermal vent metagenome TaxID=652676 RepID=A0A3B1CW88_9ZZZZ
MGKNIFRLLLSISLQIILVSILYGQYQITNQNINSGGGISSNNEYQIHSSAGAEYISSINNNEYKIQHGFWIVGGTMTSMEKDNFTIPTKFELYQNYPNPFNPTTVIKFGLPEPSNVKIEIYNMLGQKIDIVAEGNKASGYHEITWNASKLSSGIFLINFTAVGIESGHNYNQVKKALLLK